MIHHRFAQEFHWQDVVYDDGFANDDSEDEDGDERFAQCDDIVQLAIIVKDSEGMVVSSFSDLAAVGEEARQLAIDWNLDPISGVDSVYATFNSDDLTEMRRGFEADKALPHEVPMPAEPDAPFCLERRWSFFLSQCSHSLSLSLSLSRSTTLTLTLSSSHSLLRPRMFSMCRFTAVEPECMYTIGGCSTEFSACVERYLQLWVTEENE